MSYLAHVRRQTKNICHVTHTPSNTLRAFVKKNGRTYTRTEKDTEDGAQRLIRWINQTYTMEAGAGLLPNLEDRKPFDVSDIIDEYKKHPTPKRNPKSKLSKVDLSRLNRLATDPIAKVSLADESILVNYANRYVNTRKAEVEITSVEREVTLFKAMFNLACRERWFGLPDIPNPFEEIQLHYDPEEYACTRRITPEETETLLRDLQTTLQGLNRYYAPLAFIMELHTGMRQDELFALRQKDCNTDTRRISIQKRDGKGKPGSARIIPMPFLVMLLLKRLRGKLDHFDVDELIFPPSDRKNRHGRLATDRQASFATAFERRVDKLGLNDGRERLDRLTFRSLRPSARVRFEYDVGLNPDECNLMLGHSMKKRMDRTHYDEKERMRQAIQQKLDRYDLTHGLGGAEQRNFLLQNPDEILNPDPPWKGPVSVMDENSP